MRPAIFTLAFAIALGGAAMADDQPLTRNALKRQVEHLREELVRMRKQIEQVTGRADVARPMPDFEALQHAGVDSLLQPVDEALADLALAINRLQKRDAPASPAQTLQRDVTTSGASYDLSAPEGIRNRSVTIANRGANIVVNPRIVVNDTRNWYSTPDILKEILKPGMTDRDKALAIWSFLVHNRYHDEPAHHDIEIHDPVRFLCVYGYGFCDDSATNFMVLCEQAGIKARVWGLTGHVVPEAFFDGKWHMLDPDGQIYYLEDDGKTIASVETLEHRPDLFYKYPSPFYTDPQKLIDIYTTTDDNSVNEWYRQKSEAVHTLAFILRPGESLTRDRDNRGEYFSSSYLSEPDRYGNGAFVFEPVFADETFKKGAEAVHNLKAERADSAWALVADGTGTLVYRFSSPYPYLDGSVQLSGKGRVALAFSETGDVWTEVQAADIDGPIRMPLGGYFRNGYGRPTYAYFLKFTLTGRLQNLRIESDIQVAPQSLPELRPGDNTVRYIDETKGENHVRIAFGYDLEHPK